MFSRLFTDVLDEHAPMKQRYITKYQAPYMNSLLRKEMYRRNMLKNRYFKNRSDANWKIFKKQRNKVTSLHRTSVKRYFGAKCKDGDKGKSFWRTIKPFMTDSGYSHGNVMLHVLHDDRVVSDQKHIV